jgi:hypothetical protein
MKSSTPDFRHAHRSHVVCIPGERPAALDSLRAELAVEHRPSTPTEELLVDEMAQNYWRMKRYRYLEASMWVAEQNSADGKLSADLEVVQWTISSGMAAHYQRCLAASERAFYKALNTLRSLQKERGFVFTKSSEPVAEPAATVAPEPEHSIARTATAEVGFVFTNTPKAADGFVFSNSQIEAEQKSGFVFAKPNEEKTTT